jgi:hypothetical protein
MTQPHQNPPLPLPQFHQHPDGLIYIRVSSKQFYMDTPANFVLDFGQPIPALPAGANERLYIQGKSHALLNREGLVAGGEMPWKYGDVAIYGLQQILQRQKDRKAAL